jgi:hypothetical protein
MADFYRVMVADGHRGCERCHNGTFWTVVCTDEDGEIFEVCGSSWGDRELADDICDFMNMAYEAGKESAQGKAVE